MLDLYRYLYSGCPASGEGACTPLMCRTVLRGSSLQRPLRVLADRVSGHNVVFWRNVAEHKTKCSERSSGGEQEWRAGGLGVALSLVLDAPIQLQHLSLSLSSPSLTLVLPASGSVASWPIPSTLVSGRPPRVFPHETILETFPLLHRHVQFGQNADFWRPLGSREGS